MPKRAFLFAASITAIGASACGSALALWSCELPTAFLFCLALAALGSMFKVILPGLTGAISPSVMPILFAAGKLSWQETVVIAALAGVIQCLWRARQTPTMLQILFNGASLAISGGVAQEVSHRVAESSSLMLFVVAAIVYQVVNTFSVATILSLLTDAPLRALWRNIHLWSFPWSLASGGFAAVWAQANMPAGFSAAVICAVTLYLMSALYAEIAVRSNRTSQTA